MAPVYVIYPDNSDFLTSLSSEPFLEDITIKEIEVHPEDKTWYIHLMGKPQGQQQFWEKLEHTIVEAFPEVESVVFRWEQKKDDYMSHVVKHFEGPKLNNYEPVPGNTDTNGGTGFSPGQRGKGRRARLTAQITGDAAAIKDVTEEENNVVFQGEIVSMDQRETRTGTQINLFDIYDGTDSITCKFFTKPGDGVPDTAVGRRVTVKGNVQYQSFDGELCMMVNQINPAPPVETLSDNAEKRRVEFHLHTKMSGMDGTIDVGDAVAQAAAWNHRAVAITDHGVIQAFPEAYSAGQKHGIKILYGMEGYLADGEKDRPFHIIILAKNAEGLKNLYRLVSDSHMNHFYRRPRIPRDLLLEHREGLILGSACEAGEIYQSLLNQDGLAREKAAMYDFLEIQPLGNNEFLVGTERGRNREDLIRLNNEIIEIGDALGKPVIATGDVHFLRPKDAVARTVLLAGQGFEDTEHQAPLYLRTTAEMLDEFQYLPPDKAREVVIENPAAIVDSIDELTPVPQGLHPPQIPDAEEKLTSMAYATARQVYGAELPELVEKRLERELQSIIGHGYAPLYWISHKLVKKSLDDGYLVGSRGSVGSSLVATMCNITEVNPLPPHYVCSACSWAEFHTGGEVSAGVDLPDRTCPQCGTKAQKLGFDIPFEVFMGFHGDKVPDIDLNFSGDYQSQVHRYTEELFGSDHVFRAGTIGTLAEKTAFGFVKKWLEQTGQNRRSAEVNRLLKKITGVRRTTGQHPGGMMVVPEEMDIHDFTPVQYPANDASSGIVTTHFDYHAIHDSLVKLDILGHDDPTMLRMLEDITGIPVRDIALDDKETMKIFSSLDSLGVTEEQIGTAVGTLGVPEFGTRFVRQMLVETRPKTFGELVRISGLSHGTNVWSGNAQEVIKQGTADLANVIACRDDIMVYLIQKGLDPGDAFRLMEQVRKGKGLQEEDMQLIKQYAVPDWYIDSCQKISYMFPKAHAVAYVTMAYRIAYFKVHHPEAYYASYFSVRAGEFDADLVRKGQSAAREEIAAIEAKGSDATAKERNVVTILEIVLEAMARGIAFLTVDLYRSDHRRFLVTEEGLLPPLAALQGVGVNAAANIVQARSDGVFKSIQDLRQRAKITKTVIAVLRCHGALEGMSETNQLTLF